MKRGRGVGVVLAILAVAGAAFLAGRFMAQPESGAPCAEPPAQASAAEYTCSMHPQIRQPAPGRCPLCGMDLIPVAGGASATSEGRTLRLSETARKLASVETAPVERRRPGGEIRLLGRVEADPRRVIRLSLLTEGRIEALHADFTGAATEAGGAFADVYSPEVLAASEELIAASRAVAAREDGPLVRAGVDKLILLGVSTADVQRVRRDRVPLRTFTVHSPSAGIVTDLMVRRGQWVGREMPLAEIADLSNLWLQLDAYEDDVADLHTGQAVEMTFEAFPGEVFKGAVSFVAPAVAEMVRAVKVRVDLPNADGRLKPGMFGRATLRLEPTGEPVLTVPASAPLLTGRRAVVYVARPGPEGVYEGREVELGPRRGDVYEVRKGLGEGERVVVRGNFNIDSALQILGRPSMMSMPDEPTGHGATPAAGLTEGAAAVLFNAYLAIGSQLAADNLTGAVASASSFAAAAGRAADHTKGGGRQDVDAAVRYAARMAAATDMPAARTAFKGLSDRMIALAGQTEAIHGRGWVRVHCPMAFDNAGADWIQSGDKISNPYFGAEMPECGEVKERY